MKTKIYSLFLVFLMISLNTIGQDAVNVFMIARNTGKKELANLDTIRVFGFATSLGAQPNVPGPTITVKEGDSVHIDLWNVSQGAPHTIHLHGLDVDQPNDGVPHLSFDIPHMEHGYYHFKAPHAGTYLYHCHVASTIHVQAGMYGLIVVKPSDGSNTTWNNGYAFERENAYFLSEIDTTWHADTVLNHEHDTSNTVHSIKIPKYNPQFFLINGFSDQQLGENGIEMNSAANEMNYMRLANIGFYGVRVVLPSGLNAQIVDSDGRPLSAVEISDTVYVYPGERYGVLLEANTELESEIKFEYFDLNTLAVKNTQLVPVHIVGFAILPEIEANTFEFSIVPNPMDQNTVLQFYLQKSQAVELRIFDEAGRLFAEKSLKNCLLGFNAIPIANLLPDKGIYHIELVLNKHTKSTKTAVR
jgi:plastocyanin